MKYPGLNLCISDAALLFKTYDEMFSSICATYVDDTLHVKDSHHCQMSNHTETSLITNVKNMIKYSLQEVKFRNQKMD